MFSLKNETTKTIENLDVQIQEEDKLRQHARSMLSVIQRTKIQLIELHPTVNDEANQKLKVRFLFFFVYNEFFCFFFIGYFG